MARDDGGGAGNILLAFILGAVSGAALALLYAPASGRETREYLGDKAEEARARAAEAAAKGRDVKPLLGHLNAIGRDASRAAALAAVQVERADQLLSEIASRVDYALDAVRASIRRPAREGRALLRAFGAAMQAIRELRRYGHTRRGRGEDEDALFI